MAIQAYLTVGLGWGDEGKGRVVDELTRATGARTVVRHSGGPQCGHNVVLEDGRHHCFAQFGSGTFAGAGTYYSRFALFEPFALMNEAEVLAPKIGSDPLRNFCVEESAPVITPFHWIVNRARERKRGEQRHGSCGMGIGELRQDQESGLPVLIAGKLSDGAAVEEILRSVYESRKEILEADGGPVDRSFIEYTKKRYLQFSRVLNVVPDGALSGLSGPLVFENAQGIMIDQEYGAEPYRSWTDVTFRGANRLLEGIEAEKIRIGILRTYATRHGPGPFPSENPGIHHLEPHNTLHPWQGQFRQGDFDAVAAKYAIDCVGGLDGIVLTHVDRLGSSGEMRFVKSYDYGRYYGPEQGRTAGLMSARPELYGFCDYCDVSCLLGVPLVFTSDSPFWTKEKSLDVGRLPVGHY